MIPTVEMAPPLSSNVCVMSAAAQYGVPADLMLAVRSIERGTPGRSVGNTDGSRDYNEPGLNSRTMRELQAQGWDAKRLANDACYAMRASAHWMRVKLLDVRSSSLPLLARAARYNSATPVHNQRYQDMLRPALQDWSCHLHHHWKIPAESLFAVASRVTTEKELSSCRPKLNP